MTAYLIPALLCAIVLYGIYRKIPVFTSFLTGAKEGISSAISLLPTLIAITSCIGMFKASGGLEQMVRLLTPLSDLLHIPSEILPLALIRPISGSGSLVILRDLLSEFHPDSKIGKVASVLQSSSETTFYTISVYYAATSVKRTKATIPSSLCGDLACLLFSILWVTLLC